MGHNPLATMGASTPVRANRSQQVPRINRKAGLEMKGWFLRMYFVRPLMPSIPLAGEKFGEESKTCPRGQRESHRRSSLVSVGVFLDCILP